MSASRFFGSFGAPIFLSRHHYLAAPRPPIRFANPHRYCSSAVASDCAHAFPFSSENPANAWNHPWPEWASFVDCLKTKGYLTESRTASSPGDIASEGNGNVFAYADRNILKNACLNFGRDRFDILKCTFINFASRSSCKRCAGPRPKRQLNPGEWECPLCDFLNYRNNMVCKKCNHDRPRDLQAKKQYEDQLWKKPY
nr:zinc finger protein VAR3, chloroplastic [Ipomoea batatas]